LAYAMTLFPNHIHRNQTMPHIKHNAIVLLTLLSAVSLSHGTILYQNTFDDASSLDDFTVTNITQVISGELIFPASPSGSIALDLSTIPGFATTLSDNIGPISFGFNTSIKNSDQFNGGFGFHLSSGVEVPIHLGFYGYCVHGGAMVGDATAFSYSNATQGIHHSLIFEQNGIPDLPSRGTVRLDYDPSTNRWEMFLRSDTIYHDPLSLNTADSVGTIINSEFTGTPLPYLILSRQITDTTYFDNLVISGVPEPSSFTLPCFALMAFLAVRRRG